MLLVKNGERKEVTLKGKTKWENNIEVNMEKQKGENLVLFSSFISFISLIGKLMENTC